MRKLTKKELVQLMLNSIYGKLGTKNNYSIKNTFIENNIVKLKPSEIEIVDTIYSVTDIYPTTYGYSLLPTTTQNNYERFIYYDTDSIKTTCCKTLERNDKNEKTNSK